MFFIMDTAPMGTLSIVLYELSWVENTVFSGGAYIVSHPRYLQKTGSNPWVFICDGPIRQMHFTFVL